MMGIPSMFSTLWQSIRGDREADKDDSTIFVHPHTHDPTKAWEMLSVKQKVENVKHLSVKTPIHKDKVRFVCVSDTHNRMPLKTDIPDGDVLLHAGDFSMVGKPQEIVEFNDWLGSLPHKHKIVIAGNHDLTFDEQIMQNDKETLRRFGLSVEEVEKFKQERGVNHIHELLTNCTYLQDEETTLYGIRIYGSPWQPWFQDWGFNLERGKACLEKWNKIPEGIDILMTHGPPIGHGDTCKGGLRAGCVELLQTIQRRVRCKYHIFGHIHEGYGVTSDGFTRYINACTCTFNYRPCNQPIIFDIAISPGTSKSLMTRGTECADLVEESKQEEDGMEVDEKSQEENTEDKGPLVWEQNYQLEPTPAPKSSTSLVT